RSGAKRTAWESAERSPERRTPEAVLCPGSATMAPLAARRIGATRAPSAKTSKPRFEAGWTVKADAAESEGTPSSAVSSETKSSPYLRFRFFGGFLAQSTLNDRRTAILQIHTE